MKRLLLFVAAGLLSISCLMAQRTITGTVTDAVTQQPVEGAAVLIKGTTVGAYTDGDGAFRIVAPDDATVLLVTFVGKKSVEREIGSSSTMNFELADDFLELDEVVVTALGIQRDEKALGYAVQKVDGDVINRSGAVNPVDALVGKAAGVQITRSSGSVGGGSRILIRGVTSMIGNNQPLVVIDGVRVNNETLLSQASTAGTAASNRLMDLNLKILRPLTY